MLNVFVKGGVIGDGPVVGERFPFQHGETPRTLVQKVARHLPRDIPIDVAIRGRLLEEEDYDRELPDGEEIVFCAHVAGGIDLVALLVQAIIAAALSVAVNYALAALNPQPTVPDVPQERGDETSQTYSWSGIQTNYGQGFILGPVYGRHGSGGQVISTDIDTGTIQGNPDALQDQLNILLALSEGPIDKIGDVEILENGNDYLGTLRTDMIGNGSLPAFIRVNDVELSSDGNPIYGYAIPSAAFTATYFNTTTADIRSGDVLYAWNESLSVALAGTCRVVYWNQTGTAPPNNSRGSLRVDLIPPAWEAAMIAGNNVRMSREPGLSPARFFLLSSFEQVVLVPDVAGAQAFLRKGTLDQPPVPPQRFDGASVVFAPGNQLGEFGDSAIFVYNTGDDPVSYVTFTFSAPAGVYQQNQQGGTEPYPIRLTFQWRYEGETTWREFSTGGVEWIANEVRTGPWLWTLNRGFPNPVTGNVEVRVQRGTAGGPVGTSSALIWRDVKFATGYQLSYPRVACLGLSLEANARWNGGLPNFNVRVDGVKIRLYDSAGTGWSDRTWEVPDSPFDWHTYAPGRNPAWILLDFLLADWGLGNYLSDTDIDFPAFEAWAVYCDEDPDASGTPWGEPRFTCDVVIDRTRPAWEWVLAICATGRASPVFVDGKISIVYEYRDAHAQGSVSVPAKTVTQLFTSGNLSDFTVTWLPRANRPTAFVYQFLNEDFEWRQDVIPFEDPEATFNDQSELFPDEYRPQQVQAFGQTRPSQLYRDAIYRHRIGRLVTRKVDFKTGRWALASKIGDLIDIEVEMMRPFPDAPDSLVADVAKSCTIYEDVAASTTAYIDHQGIPASGSIKIRQPDGTPVVTTYTTVAEVSRFGRPCTEVTLGTSVTVDAGAPLALGTVDKLTQTYQMVAVTMNEDLTHAVTALEWVPEVHDPIPATDYEDGAPSSSLMAEQPATPSNPKTFTSEIALDATLGGAHEVLFARLPQRSSVPARVYVRSEESTIWEPVGVSESGKLDIGKRRAHSTLVVAVAFDSFAGDSPPAPDLGTVATIKVPEFTKIVPPPVSNPVWNDVNDTLMLTWDEITTVGVAFYEIREGDNWNGGRVLARTPDTRFVFETPPQAETMLICVQLQDGSQSNPKEIPAQLLWEPYDTMKAVARDELALYTGTATLVDCEIDSDGFITLSDNQFTGTYTSDEIDAGYEAPFLWRIHITGAEYDAATVDEWDFLLSDGEAAWWTVDGRGASPGLPGVDWERTVDDLSELTVDSLSDEMVHGPRGEAGSHTRLLLESRFSPDGETWGDWAEHIDGVRVCKYAQFRVTLDRETLQHEAQVQEFVITAHI